MFSVSKFLKCTGMIPHRNYRKWLIITLRRSNYLELQYRKKSTFQQNVSIDNGSKSSTKYHAFTAILLDVYGIHYNNQMVTLRDLAFAKIPKFLLKSRFLFKFVLTFLIIVILVNPDQSSISKFVLYPFMSGKRTLYRAIRN